MNRRRQLLTTAGIFGALLLAGIATYEVIREFERNTEIAILRQGDRYSVDTTAARIVAHLAGVRSDLLYLKRCASLRRYLAGDPTALEQVRADFLAFAQSKPNYDQVRYLDATGMEVVRVNNTVTGATIVPRARLQNKGKRYYFTDAFALAGDQIFVSPLDLNIEGGQVEVPHKPMIRFGVPVFDLQGEKVGVVLINYLARQILNEIGADHKMLLNQDGFWLSGGPPEDRFAFMFDSDDSFATRYPKAWQRLLARGESQVLTDDGLLTMRRVYPLDTDMVSSTGSGAAYESSIAEVAPDEYVWHVLAFRSHAQIGALHQRVNRVLLQVLIGWCFFSLAMALLLGELLERRWVYQEEQRRFDRMRGVLETAGAVCHEINQPLTGLVGYASMLLEDEQVADEKTRRRLKAMRESSERITEITSRLQHVVRYETKEYASGERILDLDAAARPKSGRQRKDRSDDAS